MEGCELRAEAQSSVQQLASGLGSSGTMTVSTTPPVPFRSVIHSGKKGISVKIVQAHLGFTSGGKPRFQPVGQVYVPVQETTANVPYVLSAIQQEFGQSYVIVTADGIELQDSPGTQGIQFWKVPSRKLFAVDEANLPRQMLPSTAGESSRKRSAPQPTISDLEDDICRVDGKLDTMTAEFSELKRQLQDLFKVTGTSVPPALRLLFDEAFKCKICLDTSTPPIIVTKCCRSILGCQSCVDQWYAGDDGLSKSCPNCRADRGYAETFRLLGVDELVNGISAKEPAAATTERNSTPDVFESDNDDLVIPP